MQLRTTRHILCAILLCLSLLPAMARAPQADVQTAWRLLDYLAVDYRGAVANGRVLSDSEYSEMNEFSASVAQRISELPPTTIRSHLMREAAQLQRAIAAKAAPEMVSRLARGLASDLLAAYPVSLAPNRAPDAARGVALFNRECASCHGATGDGHGAMAAKLNPPPVAFANAARARERSTFALYQVISQGLDGTAMASFAKLPSEDRWALAFRVGRFAFPQEAQGEKIWNSDASIRHRFPDLAVWSRNLMGRI